MGRGFTAAEAQYLVILLLVVFVFVFAVAVDYALMLAHDRSPANIGRVVTAAGMFGALATFWARQRHQG